MPCQQLVTESSELRVTRDFLVARQVRLLARHRRSGPARTHRRAPQEHTVATFAKKEARYVANSVETNTSLRMLDFRSNGSRRICCGEGVLGTSSTPKKRDAPPRDP